MTDKHTPEDLGGWPRRIGAVVGVIVASALTVAVLVGVVAGVWAFIRWVF